MGERISVLDQSSRPAPKSLYLGISPRTSKSKVPRPRTKKNNGRKHRFSPNFNAPSMHLKHGISSNAFGRTCSVHRIWLRFNLPGPIYPIPTNVWMPSLGYSITTRFKTRVVHNSKVLAVVSRLEEWVASPVRLRLPVVTPTGCL